MEMNMGKFSEKLVELLELAKKKKNVLEYQEISDFFKDQPLEVEQMEKVYDFLEASGVDVLRISGNDDSLMLDDDADLDRLDDEEEVELDKIDLSVPEGVSIEDPVRMYLKEIGKVSLFLQQKRKSNWQKKWNREMKMLRKDWQRLTCVLWSVLQSVM